MRFLKVTRCAFVLFCAFVWCCAVRMKRVWMALLALSYSCRAGRGPGRLPALRPAPLVYSSLQTMSQSKSKVRLSEPHMEGSAEIYRTARALRLPLASGAAATTNLHGPLWGKAPQQLYDTVHIMHALINLSDRSGPSHGAGRRSHARCTAGAWTGRVGFRVGQSPPQMSCA